MSLRINFFVLFFSLALNASDEKARDTYEQTYCYKFANALTTAYVLFNAVNYLADESQDFKVNDAINMAASYYVLNKLINPIVNKIVQCLPPLVTCNAINKDNSVVSNIKKEVAGFCLAVQDLATRAVCFTFVDELAVKFPASIAQDENNMGTWCQLYRNPNNFTCDQMSEKIFDTDKCSTIGINLVFVPKTDLRGSSSRYITNENTDAHLQRIVLPIKDWTKCEDCNVNFWFDHFYSDEKMVTNTKKLICEQFDDNRAALKRVYFFDLRTLPFFKSFKHIFDLLVYVYARADMARFSLPMMDQISVYSDLDIDALSKNQILSPPNLNVLKDVPLAFVASSQRLSFENGFFILTKTKNERDEQILKSFFHACALRLSSYVNDKILIHEDIIYEMIPTYCVANKMGHMISHELNFFSDPDWPRAISFSSLELGHLPNIFSQGIMDLAAHIDISDEKNYERFHNFVSAYAKKPMVNLFNNIMSIATIDKVTLEEVVKIVYYFCHLKAEKGFSCCNTIDIPSSLVKKRSY